MEQQRFGRMTSGARHIVNIRQWEEFVVIEFPLTVEHDTDEQDWRKDEMASKQNPSRPASG